MTGRISVILLLAILLQACANQPIAGGETKRFVEAQKRQAQQLQQQGKLAEALAYWRTLAPIGQADTQTKKAIKSLQKQIATKVSTLRQKAEAAYSREDQRLGDNYMLKILALQPGDSRALRSLKKSTSVKAQAQAKSRSKTELPYSQAPNPQKRGAQSTLSTTASTTSVTLPEQLQALYAQQKFHSMLTLGKSADKGDPKITKLMRRAHLGLADIANRNGNKEEALASSQEALKTHRLASDPLPAKITRLKADLSDHWYQIGRKAMSSDLEGAIGSLRKAVAYNHKNAPAKNTLAKAETLKRNLEKIEGRR